MQIKNKIVIFRAFGPIENNYLKKELNKLDYAVETFPILKVKKIYFKKINFNENDVVITTSFYGVYYLSSLSKNRDFNIYVLGRAAKILAQTLGYKNIIESNGDSAKMLRVFLEDKKKLLKDKKGEIIYAGAKDISFNLPEKLKELGFKVRVYKLYKTDPVGSFNEKFLDLIKKKKISWIILLSSKGAKRFYQLCNKQFRNNELIKIKFICVSEKVSKILQNKNYLKFFPKLSGVNYIKEIIKNNGGKYGA